MSSHNVHIIWIHGDRKTLTQGRNHGEYGNGALGKKSLQSSIKCRSRVQMTVQEALLAPIHVTVAKTQLLQREQLFKTRLFLKKNKGQEVSEAAALIAHVICDLISSNVRLKCPTNILGSPDNNFNR